MQAAFSDLPNPVGIHCARQPSEPVFPRMHELTLRQKRSANVLNLLWMRLMRLHSCSAPWRHSFALSRRRATSHVRSNWWRDDTRWTAARPNAVEHEQLMGGSDVAEFQLWKMMMMFTLMLRIYSTWGVLFYCLSAAKIRLFGNGYTN